jgi:hypothetical protein
MAFGGQVFDGGSKLWTGPLGVTRIGFKGFDLGKTTAETTLEIDEDVLDIIYQQDGTKAADHVSTGVDYLLTCTFGEINTGILDLLIGEISSVQGAQDSGTFGRSLYTSLRDTEGGVLKVAPVDPNGQAYSDAEDVAYFYEAIPVTNGPIANWAADAQRGLPVQFRIKFHVFADGESVSKYGAFGYYGDPTSEDVPAAAWPDVEAPILQSITVADATDITVVFNEDIAFVGGSFSSGMVSAEVDGVIVLATAGAIATDTATITFPAATFAAGNVVKVTIASQAIEDTETTANVYGGVSGYLATNPLV